MSETGRIGWIDQTTPDADRVRDFYAAVAGWQAEPVDMGGYSDYTMMTADGVAVGGICHTRGANAAVPPGWLIYITVPDLDAALEAAGRLGGRRFGEVRGRAGEARFCVIQDPGGAMAVLYEARRG